VASAIEQLKPRFPQLADFSAAKHLALTRPAITYGYHTHRARHRGGWTAGVPNPDADGIWFYIDVHDPGSTAQIHTQPEIRRLYYQKRPVMLLLLNGAKARPISAALYKILRQQGARDAP